MKNKELLRRIEALEAKLSISKEEPKELEVGKWYKCIGEPKFLAIHLLNNRYGFDCDGEWFDNVNEKLFNDGFYTEATLKEVEKALIKEAKRRYKVGDKLSINDDYNIILNNDFYFSHLEENNTLYVVPKGDSFVFAIVFDNGKWAEVIKNDDKPKVGDVVTNGRLFKKVKENSTIKSGWRRVSQQEVIELLFGK